MAALDGMLVVFAGLLGLAVGSFLNVVIYRVPAGLSVVSPPSRCPVCEHEIRNRHNIPVLGWLILRGRCYDCKTPISPRYPIVEGVTGALFAAVAAVLLHRHLGQAVPAFLYLTAAVAAVLLHRHLGQAVPAFLYLTAVGVALAMIDFDHKRLPNSIVLPSYPVLAALLVVASALTHDWWALARAGIGGVALYATFYALMAAYPKGMGFGDVKLAGVLGGAMAWLSWATFGVGAFGGFVLGSLVGLGVMASGRGTRKTAIPFGPFMIAGALIAVFVAQPIAHAYLQLMGRR